MLPSADLTDNPAASDKPTSSGETAEDTNAVVSPSHTDFLLTRIGGTFAALPIAVPYVDGVWVAWGGCALHRLGLALSVLGGDYDQAC